MKLADEGLWATLGSAFDVSPDGSRIAYVTGTDARRELYVRPLDQLTGAKLVEGNEDDRPYLPFLSPDGRWVGYVTPTELRKVPMSGGTPLVLCKVSHSRGVSWGEDDTIVFAPSPNSGLFRVAAAGGEPKPLTTLDEAKKEKSHRWPQALPGGKAVLFTSHVQVAGDFDNASIEVVMVATVDVQGGVFRTGQPRTLFTGTFQGGISGLTLPNNVLVDYEVSKDGQRFVMFPATGSQNRLSHVTLVSSWLDELEKTFASKNR